MRIALSVGHNPDSQGLTSGVRSEYSECAPMSGWCSHTLTRLGIKAYPVPTGEILQKIDWINSQQPPFDLVVEFHLNGFPTAAYGTEVLYHPTSILGPKYASRCSALISERLDTRNRGGKPRRNLALLNRTHCTAIIIEPFFMIWEGYLFDVSSGNLLLPLNEDLHKIIGSTAAVAIHQIKLEEGL